MTVDFLTRAAIAGLAAYALAGTAASLAVAAAWRRALRVPDTPHGIARLLFAMRLAPAALGLLAGLMTVGAFLLFEANPHREAVGPAALAGAGAGLLLLAMAAVRSVSVIRASSALRRQWRARRAVRIDGCPVDVVAAEIPFPVVALLGCVRPRLIVASHVLEACTPAEIDVVIAHEMAHLSARDNLRRILFAVSPDALGGSRAARDMERAWAEATELAADDRAAGASTARRLDLASALVKVARLAANAAVPALPASALFRGEPVADRVRRLVGPPPDSTRHSPRTRLLALTAASAIAAGLPAGTAVAARGHRGRDPVRPLARARARSCSLARAVLRSLLACQLAVGSGQFTRFQPARRKYDLW